VIIPNQILKFYNMDGKNLKVTMHSTSGVETGLITIEEVDQVGVYELPGRFSSTEWKDFVRLRLLVTELFEGYMVFGIMLMVNDTDVVGQWERKRVNLGQSRSVGLFTVRLQEVREGLIILP
jgi:hypothetical protein